MKKKQIWALEYDCKEENVVYLKSHLKRYMSGDLKGKATCEVEEVGEMEKFTLVYKTDGSGKWAFKNKKSGYFLGCAAQEVGGWDGGRRWDMWCGLGLGGVATFGVVVGGGF